MIKEGFCYVLFAFEVAMSIDLDACDKLITETKERTKIRRSRRTPTYFDYRPSPVRITQPAKPVTLGKYYSRSSVDLTLYDFGAISVAYTIPLGGSFKDLLALSCELGDHDFLVSDARDRVAQIVAEITPAVTNPKISDSYEDYSVFEIETFERDITFQSFVQENRALVSQILGSETERLSETQIAEALSCIISYGPDDLTVIDWNSAFIFGADGDDVRAVLEFANVELLEMRHLDTQLDDALDESHKALTSNKLGRFAKLHRISRLQVDSAILYEGVNNALKLLGDQFLARVYALVSRRFHLADWDSSIIRKLQVIDSIYRKISDNEAQKRLEVLEWIIIILIAVSVALPFIVKT